MVKGSPNLIDFIQSIHRFSRNSPYAAFPLKEWSSQLMRTGLVLSLHLPCHTFVLNLLSFTNSPYKTTFGSAGLSSMEWPAPTPDS